MKNEICFGEYRYHHHTTASPLHEKFVRHSHRTYEILFFFGGEVSYIIENRRFPLVPGDIVLVPAFRYHYAVIEGDTPYERAVIDFADGMADKELLGRAFGGASVYHAGSLPFFYEYCRRLDGYAAFPDGEDKKLLAAVTLTELLCLLARLDPSLAAPAGEREDPTVDAAIRYMEAHLTTIEDLNEICRALFISRSHLYHAFSEVMDVSPMQYLRRRRLLYAHELLRSGEKPTGLYAACGFRDYSSFYRAYRAYFGMSPTAGAQASPPH